MQRAISIATPAWILCRNRDEVPIRDEQTLLDWTRQGRVRPSDYLFNPRLDTCVQAKDLESLERIFRSMPARRLTCLARGLGVAGLAVIWLEPAAGSLALFAGVMLSLICMKEGA